MYSMKWIPLLCLFLGLTGRRVSVPRTRHGAGGGLASFGDDVLLLTHDGRVFIVRSENEVLETSIEVPDNGFAEYRQAADSSKYKSYKHNLNWFRYNDIVYFIRSFIYWSIYSRIKFYRPEINILIKIKTKF